MNLEEYWMGKGIDLDDLWRTYEEGNGYIDKVSSSELYLVRLTFSGPPQSIPLFDAELIYKTVKGTFHDVKEECFDHARYNKAAPIFLRRIDRGSGIFEFLGQFDPVITWVSAIGGAMLLYRKIYSMDLESDHKKIEFLLSKFPNASKGDISAYIKAWTTFGRRRILERLIEHGLEKVEISTSPVEPDPIGVSENTLDLNEILEDEDGEQEKLKINA